MACMRLCRVEMVATQLTAHACPHSVAVSSSGSAAASLAGGTASAAGGAASAFTPGCLSSSPPAARPSAPTPSAAACAAPSVSAGGTIESSAEAASVVSAPAAGSVNEAVRPRSVCSSMRLLLSYAFTLRHCAQREARSEVERQTGCARRNAPARPPTHPAPPAPASAAPHWRARPQVSAPATHARRAASYRMS